MLRADGRYADAGGRQERVQTVDYTLCYHNIEVCTDAPSSGEHFKVRSCECCQYSQCTREYEHKVLREHL